MCDEIVKIIVEKRLDDYSAFIEGHREIWGSSITIDGAIGDLINSHQERFCVKIQKL